MGRVELYVKLETARGKTKELVVDFHRARHSPSVPVNIQGTDTEIVSSCRYLGVHLNHKLHWTDNTAALYRKGQSRLHLLRRLRSFGEQGALLRRLGSFGVQGALLRRLRSFGV
ncbi:hypothetical protein NFI96_002597 [Prochilodus magdalenae]|nr:hypothetical protein NFI96_002597 [Prochilodus magdalenae]